MAVFIRNAFHAIGDDVYRTRLLCYADRTGFALVVRKVDVRVEFWTKKTSQPKAQPYRWDAASKMYAKPIGFGLSIMRLWHPKGWLSPVVPKPLHHFRKGDHIYRIAIA